MRKRKKKETRKKWFSELYVSFTSRAVSFHFSGLAQLKHDVMNQAPDWDSETHHQPHFFTICLSFLHSLNSLEAIVQAFYSVMLINTQLFSREIRASFKHSRGYLKLN